MAFTRRRLLGAIVAATTSLGGCVRDPVNDSSLSVHFDRIYASELGNPTVHRLGEEHLSWPQRQFVASAVPNGTTTYGHRPFEAGTFLSVNETYYRLTMARNGSGTVRRPVVRGERVETANGSIGDRSDLSSDDIATIQCAVATADEGPNSTPCVLHAGNRSEFWPTPPFEYLDRQDGYVHLSVSAEPVTLDRYEYDLELVARNHSTFVDYLARKEVAIDFGERNVTGERQEILSTAAAEGVYRESPPYSEALKDLVQLIRRLTEHRDRYVRFDGAYYRVHVGQSHDD